MHSQKVIHCDLKPDNILINSNQQIKISDFGLTTTTKSVLEQYRCGTLSSDFIAPELMDKKRSTRNRNVDLYSFGVILFEMCFCPLPNRERRDLLDRIQQSVLPIPDKYVHHKIYPVFWQVTLSAFVKYVLFELYYFY